MDFVQGIAEVSREEKVRPRIVSKTLDLHSN
jgi:hypothetical protein